MKVVAFPRNEQGSGASRRLRRAGQTPGIIYGGTTAPVNIALDHNALFHALKKEAFHSSILDMEVDGKSEKVLLRDFQMHAFKPHSMQAVTWGWCVMTEQLHAWLWRGLANWRYQTKLA